ncbi:MAG: hypothetical protein K0Q81_2190, partial [Paenibacillus sp.]|nr:hypothetical protein [Paenibacillus sp.]
MANTLRLLLISWGRGVVELLLFFPVLLLLTPLAGMADIFPYWLLALTLFMPLGALARLLVRSELRLIHLVIGAIVVGAISILAFGYQFAGWGAILAGGVLYYHGFGTVRAGWHARFPVGLMWIALFIFLLAGLILPRLELYASYSSVLGWLGVLAVAVTFFISNKSNLEEETHSG